MPNFSFSSMSGQRQEDGGVCMPSGLQPNWGSGSFTTMTTTPSLTLSERNLDTPRDSFTLRGRSLWGPEDEPASPDDGRKSRSRAGMVYRSDSLRESKVLMVNDVRRTDSVLHPDLFQYQNHFEFISLIGQTQTSEVFKVRHQATGELFAVKRSKRRFRSKLQRERCLREVRAVSSLPPHPNLVSQHRAWQESGHFYIQMDLCEGGNLHEAVVATKGRGLSDAQAWQVAHDVAAGLSFLHASGILHLDIKPENIYRGGVAHDARWRIGDFGLAVANECADWEEGDGNYVAPELLLGSDPAAPADVFSLGATLFECVAAAAPPRGGVGREEELRAALGGRSQALARLILSALASDPRARPSAAEMAARARAEGAARGGDDGTWPAARAPPCARPAPLQVGLPAPRPRAEDATEARWAPALSPLPSEEGCATPSEEGEAPGPGKRLGRGAGADEPPSQAREAMHRRRLARQRAWRPEGWEGDPPELSAEDDGATAMDEDAGPSGRPRSASSAGDAPPAPWAGPRAAAPARGGSFRLRRRDDAPSPASDWGASCASDSEAAAGSSEASRGSLSDLEFLDTVPRDVAGRGHAPSLTPAAEGRRRATPPPRSSLAWDLYASPEFLVQLPPAGSPPEPAPEPAPRAFSLRRFPTLEHVVEGAWAAKARPASRRTLIASLLRDDDGAKAAAALGGGEGALGRCAGAARRGRCAPL